VDWHGVEGGREGGKGGGVQQSSQWQRPSTGIRRVSNEGGGGGLNVMAAGRRTGHAAAAAAAQQEQHVPAQRSEKGSAHPSCFCKLARISACVTEPEPTRMDSEVLPANHGLIWLRICTLVKTLITQAWVCTASVIHFHGECPFFKKETPFMGWLCCAVLAAVLC
jgi:hypothetical protein